MPEDNAHELNVLLLSGLRRLPKTRTEGTAVKLIDLQT